MNNFQSHQQDAFSAYIPSEEENTQKAPAQKAWDTARNEAVRKATGPLDLENAELIRAATDKNLAHGAVRLFLLIAKLAWKKEFGGWFKGRCGSLQMTTRSLARMLRVNVKSFYDQPQKKKVEVKGEKPKYVRTGKVTPGWINLLVQGGYIWVSRHKIPNIPEDKSLNVYNLSIFVPRTHTPPLAWADGNFGTEATVTHNGHSDFSASEDNGHGERQENGTDSAETTERPVTHNGHSPCPITPVANTPQRARAESQNGHSPCPTTPAANTPQRARAESQNGHGPYSKSGHKRELNDSRLERTTVKTVSRLDKRAVAGASENEFLELCLEVFGDREMRTGGPKGEGNGGLWRTLLRQNPEKAWSVLHETRATKRERPATLKTTWAQFAMDLWNNDRVGT